jgi:uncharacterized repeat protein (TIGR03803 family)
MSKWAGPSYTRLVLSGNGSLYGVTYAGGAHGLGAFYEITP